MRDGSPAVVVQN
jgi:hypothetical protein